MKNTVIAFAQDHARGILRGFRTPHDIVETIRAMKGIEGPLAAALYALEVASLVPDSVEVQIRSMLGEWLEVGEPAKPPVVLVAALETIAQEIVDSITAGRERSTAQANAMAKHNLNAGDWVKVLARVSDLISYR